MPEGPEVKITTDYLKQKLERCNINQWNFFSTYSAKRNPGKLTDFLDGMPWSIIDVSCKGKTIFISFFNGIKHMYLVHSLRMTGRWQEYRDKQCVWSIELDNGQELFFRNPRRLATIYFTDDESELNRIRNELGPDILTPQFTLNVWNNLCQKHSGKNITSFLMNQKIISGCGNYLKAEALYRAKLSPFHSVGNLSSKQLEKLYDALCTIANQSYQSQGVTIRDYANSQGQKSSKPLKLYVYGQSNSVRTKTPDGRITHWNPKIQL